MNYYHKGSYNIYCQRCQHKRKHFEMKLEWTGLLVCADKCWEPKHPSLTPPVIREDISVPRANGSKDLSATSQPIAPFKPVNDDGTINGSYYTGN